MLLQLLKLKIKDHSPLRKWPPKITPFNNSDYNQSQSIQKTKLFGLNHVLFILGSCFWAVQIIFVFETVHKKSVFVFENVHKKSVFVFENVHGKSVAHNLTKSPQDPTGHWSPTFLLGHWSLGHWSPTSPHWSLATW